MSGKQSNRKLMILCLIVVFGLFARSLSAQQYVSIGQGVLHVLGMGLSVDPEEQTAPINTGTAVNTNMVFPAVDFGSEIPGVPLEAVELEYNNIYVLKLPMWKLVGEDYVSEILVRGVRLVKKSDHTFVIFPIEDRDNEKWVKSVNEPTEAGWVGEIKGGNSVGISGLITLNGDYALLELKGEFVNRTSIRGSGAIRVGIGRPTESPFLYKCEWALEPEQIDEPLEISNRVTYHGPSVPAPREPEITSPADEAKRPSQSDTSMKRMAAYDRNFRSTLYSQSSIALKKQYDTVLAELTWEEMKYTPGILLLVDHLASLDEEDQRRIAEGYVRDGSIDFFGDTPYTELQKVPPLFLILKSIDQMNESDIGGLKSSSLRFLKMLKAYQQIPPDELADAALDDFLVRVSEEWPIDLREAYYRDSPKLRAYVESPEGSSLRALYPFKVND